MVSSGEVLRRVRNVRLVCLDFDGTLTDGKVYVDQIGNEMVCCSRRDSLGIELLKQAGISVCVISKETNPVVAVRCKKMGIACIQSVFSGEGKSEILQRLAAEAKLDLSQVAFMGDDVNDLAGLRIVGFAATVADGHPLVREAAHYSTEALGGQHAVREFCDFLLRAQGRGLTL